MGGEHALPRIQSPTEIGSSPHGRGTSPICCRRLESSRFIPAWAGNINRTGADCRSQPVHPRMGGEHESFSLRTRATIGSSPHGRGTCIWGASGQIPHRFIPAWAGNMARPARPTWSPPVHPRMGGEHPWWTSRIRFHTGSSPHGRGTSLACLAQDALQRFIPAWAGNISPWSARRAPRSVHPRMGGEHCPASTMIRCRYGSSPHGRGTFGLHLLDFRRRRFIPAWAGNISWPVGGHQHCAVHPRMGGEHPVRSDGGLLNAGSSPHGRGTSKGHGRVFAYSRFIPAWAGNMTAHGSTVFFSAVHPRMGGEHRNPNPGGRPWPGSSPHGRGT